MNRADARRYGGCARFRVWTVAAGCPRHPHLTRGFALSTSQRSPWWIGPVYGVCDKKRRPQGPPWDAVVRDGRKEKRAQRALQTTPLNGAQRSEHRQSEAAASLRLDDGDEAADPIAKRFVGIHQVGDLVARIHRGGVVFLAELARDLRQRCAGELPGDVHRDLPW